MTLTIFDQKGFALHDGPGIRTTVFCKGCPLRCLWCHNPEGLSPTPQLCVKETACVHCGKCRLPCTHPDCQPYGRCLHICPTGCISIAGEAVDTAVLAERLARDKDIFAMSGEDVSGDTSSGGVTFSGGEPLLQWQAVVECADLLHEKGIHVAIETSGYATDHAFCKTIAAMDYVIMDVKLANPVAHKKYTGVDNAPILQNLRTLQESGKPYLLRTPQIPGITDTDENLSAIRTLIGENAPWETLPYNTLAGAKYKNFGMQFGMDTI